MQVGVIVENTLMKWILCKISSELVGLPTVLPLHVMQYRPLLSIMAHVWSLSSSSWKLKIISCVGNSWFIFQSVKWENLNRCVTESSLDTSIDHQTERKIPELHRQLYVYLSRLRGQMTRSGQNAEPNADNGGRVRWCTKTSLYFGRLNTTNKIRGRYDMSYFTCKQLVTIFFKSWK